MNNNLKLDKQIGVFKLKDYMEVWIEEYKELRNLKIDIEMSSLLTIELISDRLFKYWGHTNKYKKIQTLITKIKQLEFKGNNIEDDFSIFVKLEDKIKEKAGSCTTK